MASASLGSSIFGSSNDSAHCRTNACCSACGICIHAASCSMQCNCMCIERCNSCSKSTSKTVWKRRWGHIAREISPVANDGGHSMQTDLVQMCMQASMCVQVEDIAPTLLSTHVCCIAHRIIHDHSMLHSMHANPQGDCTRTQHPQSI